MTVQNSKLSGNSWPGDMADQTQAIAPQVPSRRKTAMISRSNLVLAGLFAAGIAAITLLHFKAGPATASAAALAGETRMDTLLATLTQVRSDCNNPAANAVINTFYYEARQRQIPPDQLATNPFRLTISQAPPPATQPDGPPDQAPPPDPEAQALSEALANIHNLALQSVLTGSAGATAMISNNVLTVGQKICGWTVVEIGPRDVVLEWKGHRHTLTMK